MGHSVVASLILALLVLTFLVKLVLHFNVQVIKLLVVTNLVSLEWVVDFLALIDCVLLDVLDLSKSSNEKNKRYAQPREKQHRQQGAAAKTENLLVDIFEFEFELPLLLVTLGHHLVEVGLDLDHLPVQAPKFFVGLPRLIVHLRLYSPLNYNKF